MDQEKLYQKKILKYSKDGVDSLDDQLAKEEPLQINITALDQPFAVHDKNIAVTMRTPGDDINLSLGFLYTEGIIDGMSEVKLVRSEDNLVSVHLNDQAHFDLKKLERNFYSTSSCGICGKASIESIRNQRIFEKPKAHFSIDAQSLQTLPEKLRIAQNIFSVTGGLHAAALFNLDLELLNMAEDVGRHNALDKLIGANFQNQMLPLYKHILLLSGRSSFELIQKAKMAGVQMVLSVGAPSSLAVELAEEFDMTLIGFLSSERFNIYHGSKRVIF